MKRQDRLLTALMAAALCVMAPWAVPLGPVPVSLATLGVYLAVGLLGGRRGTAAVGLYMVLGAVGLPVFSGFTGGLQPLVGLTGGYIWGYILCAAVAGLLRRVSHRPWGLPLALAAGTAVLYVAGTAWYLWQTGGTVTAALTVCVLPFLPADGAKIAVATLLILSLRRPLERLAVAARHEGN